jgi:oxygen-independent coproporphyrinogen-3 oxidase
MAGIYIHIPFCKQACTYCDFYFTTSGKWMKPLLDGIIKEISIQKNFFNHDGQLAPIDTIYFGGGTPSLIPPDAIKMVIDTIRIHYQLNANAEITLEVNPEDVNQNNIKHWAEAGVNRISMGIQSFNNDDLKLMNRSHNEQQAISAVKRLQDGGIVNMSVDLIYGIPKMTAADWINNLHKAFELNVPHLSCYSLTVEDKTVLAHLVNKGTIIMDEKLAGAHFEILMKEAANEGFEQYEISNFCKPGFESKHNSSYWKGTPYLGVGPSAHSYNGNWRQFNKPNLFTYLKAIEKNEIDAEREDLTEVQKYHELLMIGLRTKWGVNKNMIEQQFNQKINEHFQTKLHVHSALNNIITNKNIITLTTQAKLKADTIIEDFFM